MVAADPFPSAAGEGGAAGRHVHTAFDVALLVRGITVLGCHCPPCLNEWNRIAMTDLLRHRRQRRERGIWMRDEYGQATKNPLLPASGERVISPRQFVAAFSATASSLDASGTLGVRPRLPGHSYGGRS